MPAGSWTDANVHKFVMYMCFALSATGGSPNQHFPIIAEKLGADFTPSACANKWHRLKTDFEKENGPIATLAATTGTPKKVTKTATPKKTPKTTEVNKEGQVDNDDDSGDKTPASPVTPARKRGRPVGTGKPKNKDGAKAKVDSPRKRQGISDENNGHDAAVAVKKPKMEAEVEAEAEEHDSDGEDGEIAEV